MQRMGMIIGLNADKVQEYKRLHAAVWPEILAKISECNITNYSIFLKEPENLLFGYWEYTGSELRRRYWPMVDQGQEDDSRDVLLLEGVKRLEVRFLDSNRSWQPQWPTDEVIAGLTPGSRPDVPLPLGMEVTLEHERFGTLVRTFALPDFDPAVAQGALNQANQAASEAEEESTEEEGTTEQPGENTSATGQGG